ncbi:MAG: TerB family tellurite resistance protein [Alphaproteobacteria bacterium]|nr:TerB family tellurite resistance protein [Alphaproteobacteria bacterium]
MAQIAARKQPPVTALRRRAAAPNIWDRLSEVFRPANSSVAPAPVPANAISPASHVEEGENPRQVVFTLSLIALSAKLMKADAPATKEEYFAFRRLFPMPKISSQRMQELFISAYKDSGTTQFYARRIAELYRGESAMLEEVLRRWLKVAGADGVVRAPEILLLQDVAREFGVGGAKFHRLFEEYMLGNARTPYEVMGVSKDITDAELKKAYRQRLRDYHPDGMIAAGLDQPYIDIACKKAVVINEAYEMICKKRGMR